MGAGRSIPAGEDATRVLAAAPSRTGGATHQGKRRDQEDRLAIRSYADAPLGALHVSELATVIDGHGGNAAAQFTAEHLLAAVERGLAKADSLQAASAALRRAFVETERALYATSVPRPPVSGACVLVAAVTPDVIILASAGDCRSVLIEGGTYRTVSIEHKPTLPEETARITAAGLSVIGVRVRGELAVSRSIGDGNYKGAPAGAELSSAVDDVAEQALSGAASSSASACSDAFNPSAVAEIVVSAPTASDADTASRAFAPQAVADLLLPQSQSAAPASMAVSASPSTALPAPMSTAADDSAEASFSLIRAAVSLVENSDNAAVYPEIMHAVTCVPDVSFVPRTSACQALLLMTDGAYCESMPAIFDAVLGVYRSNTASSDDDGEAAAGASSDNGTAATSASCASANAAAAMCNAAIAAGSSDNVTVVVVPLN